MTGQVIAPRVNIPPSIQQGNLVTWEDVPFSDAGGSTYASDAYGLQYAIAGQNQPLTVNAAASGRGWLTTLSVAQTAGLSPGLCWWQAVLTATGFALTVARGQLVIVANLATVGVGFSGLSEAEQALKNWQAALAALCGSNGKPPVQSYRIGSREMRHSDISEILQAIAYWQSQVLKEQTANSIAQGQGNPRKLYARFPNRFT
jgi:hypothetical protein